MRTKCTVSAKESGGVGEREQQRLDFELSFQFEREATALVKMRTREITVCSRNSLEVCAGSGRKP